MDFTTRCLGNFSLFSLIIIINPSSATVDLVKQTHAYPAQDGDSRMIFVIEQDSVVFENDLGKKRSKQLPR